MSTAGDGGTGDNGGTGEGEGQDEGGTGTGGSGSGGSGGSGDSGGGDSGGDGGSDVAQLLTQLGLTPQQAADRLRNAPKWERRARDNASKAQKAGTLEQQLAAVQQQLADRDVRETERAGKAAKTAVRAKLAEGGIQAEDVAAILDRVNGVDLLKDGDPDDSAIDALATSLLRIAGRVQPDPDQGKRGGEVKEDMNAFIRRQAGRGQRTIRT